MNIKRSGSQPSSRGQVEYFTGSVRIDPLFDADDPARVIVTYGCGFVQSWGGPIEVNRPGDVVWCTPDEKHWHGGTPTTAMTHIEVIERLDGKTVEWMEKVTDEQYAAAPTVR